MLRLVYKYKKGDPRDVTALLSDELWASSSAKMNDPDEMAFGENKEKIEKEAGIDPWKIGPLVEFFHRQFGSSVFLSFGASPRNRRLWGYYTDGFRGFAVGYRLADVEASVSKAVGEDFSSDWVRYVKEKDDLTDSSITQLKSKEKVHMGLFGDCPSPAPFQKMGQWKAEKEYRFSIGSAFLAGSDGRYLEGLPASSVYIGMLAPQETKKAIAEYCSSKGVKAFICMPDFFSKRNRLRIIPCEPPSKAEGRGFPGDFPKDS